jgi:hypothetical protein
MDSSDLTCEQAGKMRESMYPLCSYLARVTKRMEPLVRK